MEKSGYERYGLTGNPFRDLASESIDNLEIYHVQQEIDDQINLIMDEVIDKENKAVLAVLGGLGAGKTERLLMAQFRAKKRDVFCVYQSFSSEIQWAVKAMIETLLSEAKLTGLQKVFSAPSWFKAVEKVHKNLDKGTDAVQAGKAIAEALNAKAPSMLLLNDLHHLKDAKDNENLMRIAYEILNNIRPGVLIMFSSTKPYFDNLVKHNTALADRINKLIQVPPLTEDEACLMVAKRMLVRRLVEDLDPLYPFSRDGIAAMNAKVQGIPRPLLKLADLIIESAAKRKAIKIDAEMVTLLVAEDTKMRELIETEVTRSCDVRVKPVEQESSPHSETQQRSIVESTQEDGRDGSNIKDQVAEDVSPTTDTESSARSGLFGKKKKKTK